MTEYTGIPQIDAWLADADEITNRFGNRVRKILVRASRYCFDFGLDSEKWEQFDTESDAFFFGVWTNKSERQMLSYIEGDVFFTQCTSDESYDLELAAECAFHTPASASDGEGATKYHQARARYFIDPERAMKELPK